MKPRALVSALGQVLAAGDINASCGVLRRLLSESPPNDRVWTQLTAPMPTDARATPHAFASVDISTPPLRSSSVYHTASPSPVPHRGGQRTLSTHPRPTGQGLIHHALALGLACLEDNPALVRPSSVTVLCHAAQQIGAWQDALRLCRSLKEPPSPLFLASLLKPGNVKAVLEVTGREKWPLDVAAALRVLAHEQGDWASALYVAEEYERRFPVGEPYTLGVLIPYLAAHGHPAKATALFDSGIAHGALVEAPLVEELIVHTVRLRQWETCLHMLRQLSKVQETAQLLPPSAELYRRIMDVSPGWEVSMEVFRMTLTADVKPDQRAIAALLAQCDRAGAWAEATNIYDLAVKEGFVENLALDSSYHTLVRAFTAAQQWEKALEALSWMPQTDEASITAGKSELLELCEQSGQWAAAIAVGTSLLEGGQEWMPPHTVLSLLFACAKGAQWSMATRLFSQQMRDVRSQPHPLALCAALQACTSAGEWAQALSLFCEARAQQPRVVVPPLAHRLVVKACARHGRWHDTLQLLSTMQNEGLPMDNSTQRLGLWAAALDGQWQLSLSFLQRIPSRSRTTQDRLIIRSATRYVSADANAAVLRHLHLGPPS